MCPVSHVSHPSFSGAALSRIDQPAASALSSRPACSALRDVEFGTARRAHRGHGIAHRQRPASPRLRLMAPTLPTVRRIDFGYFLRPADETGTGKPRVEPLLGYAIVHRDGVVLFDTGLGEGDADADGRYRPMRRTCLP